MKKIIISIMLSLILPLMLFGCSNTNIQENSSVNTQQQSQPIDIKYYSLKYEGMDTNPQNNYEQYEVDDKTFVVDVWNAVNYSEWIERNNDSEAMVAIWLRFISDDEIFFISVDPCDVGCRIVSVPDEFLTDEQLLQPNPETKYYYDMPKGTYEKVSKMLTEYTQNHF